MDPPKHSEQRKTVGADRHARIYKLAILIRERTGECVDCLAPRRDL